MVSRPWTVRAKGVLPFLFVALLITQLGLSLGDLPALKLMQDIICKRYYHIDSSELLPEPE